MEMPSSFLAFLIQARKSGEWKSCPRKVSRDRSRVCSRRSNLVLGVVSTRESFNTRTGLEYALWFQEEWLPRHVSVYLSLVPMSYSRSHAKVEQVQGVKNNT
jgi:hypothetical protein